MSSPPMRQARRSQVGVARPAKIEWFMITPAASSSVNRARADVFQRSAQVWGPRNQGGGSGANAQESVHRRPRHNDAQCDYQIIRPLRLVAPLARA